MALPFLLIMATACSIDTEREQEGNKEISYLILGDMYTGYTYQIFISGKLFIDQTVMPAVGGLQKFKNAEQAEAVAKLVVVRFRKAKPPSITINDLDSLGISYNKTSTQ